MVWKGGTHEGIVIKEANLWDSVNGKLRKSRRVTPRCLGAYGRRENRQLALEEEGFESEMLSVVQWSIWNGVWPVRHWADLRP